MNPNWYRPNHANREWPSQVLIRGPWAPEERYQTPRPVIIIIVVIIIIIVVVVVVVVVVVIIREVVQIPETWASAGTGLSLGYLATNY